MSECGINVKSDLGHLKRIEEFRFSMIEFYYLYGNRPYLVIFPVIQNCVKKFYNLFNLLDTLQTSWDTKWTGLNTKEQGYFRQSCYSTSLNSLWTFMASQVDNKVINNDKAFCRCYKAFHTHTMQQKWVLKCQAMNLICFLYAQREIKHINLYENILISKAPNWCVQQSLNPFSGH